MVAELESKVICAVWARIMRGYGIGTTLLIKMLYGLRMHRQSMYKSFVKNENKLHNLKELTWSYDLKCDIMTKEGRKF